MATEPLAALEALLFIAGEPVSTTQVAEVLNVGTSEAVKLCQELADQYAARSQSGLLVQETAGGWRLCTRPEYGKLLAERYAPPLYLSKAALEVLAIVALQAPVTRQQIDGLRGVSSERTLAKLLEKNLIMEIGRAELPGRPILYDVTPYFKRKTNWRDYYQKQGVNENDERTSSEID